MKSILIIGLGRFGRHLAARFIEQGNSVMAIEKDEARADSAIDICRKIQIGDATDENYMKTLGVNNFDICVVAIADNFQVSLEITVLLKECGANFVLARATRDVHKKILLNNGADQVVYAEKELAARLAVKLGNDSIFDYIELNEEYSIYEIAVPEDWCGKTLAELGVRAKYNVSVLATKSNGQIFPQLSPTQVFTSDETIMVMGSNEAVHRLTRE